MPTLLSSLELAALQPCWQQEQCMQEIPGLTAALAAEQTTQICFVLLPEGN